MIFKNTLLDIRACVYICVQVRRECAYMCVQVRRERSQLQNKTPTQPHSITWEAFRQWIPRSHPNLLNLNLQGKDSSPSFSKDPHVFWCSQALTDIWKTSFMPSILPGSGLKCSEEFSMQAKIHLSLDQPREVMHFLKVLTFCQAQMIRYKDHSQTTWSYNHISKQKQDLKTSRGKFSYPEIQTVWTWKNLLSSDFCRGILWQCLCMYDSCPKNF